MSLQDTRQKLRNELEAPAPLRTFGTGWISGVAGLALGLIGLALVVSMRAPGQFAMPELSALHANHWFKLGVLVILLLGFAASVLSLALRASKLLGTLGAVAALLAALLGGSASPALTPDPTPLFLGLDWFALNVLFTGLIFIPMERISPLRAEQPLFRDEWREDIFYYLVSSFMVQVLAFVSFAPAKWVAAASALVSLQQWVAGLPFVVQLVAIMFLTDFVQYWVHRAFHRVPWLWGFHAVHHSAQSMDWMAGARMHFLEILILRTLTVIPMFALGFAPTAVNVYILLVYLYSTFIHANLSWRLPVVDQLLVTPRFHHWHHGIEKEAIDVNFSIHFPLFDRLFGTHYLPKDKWPAGYGIEGHPVPKGYWAQLLYPFRRR